MKAHLISEELLLTKHPFAMQCSVKSSQKLLKPTLEILQGFDKLLETLPGVWRAITARTSSKNNFTKDSYCAIPTECFN